MTRFEAARPFAPWIARIAANRVVDLMRRESRRAVSLDAGTAPAGDDHYDSLLAAIAQLPDDRRAVVVIHFFLGFSLEETAELSRLPRTRSPRTTSSSRSTYRIEESQPRRRRETTSLNEGRV